MGSSSKLVALLAGIGVTAAAAFVAVGPGPTTAEPCAAQPGWFVNPQQPDNFDVDDDNCRFHQWGWQQFLWLTAPATPGGQINLLGLAYPEDLFASTDSAPAYPGRGATPGLLSLAPSLTKVPEITQAGQNPKVLVDQQGRVVFYAVFLDRGFYDFVRDNRFFNPTALAAAPDTLNFPLTGTGALEIKTAWRVAVKGDSVLIPAAETRFYTTAGEVPRLGIRNDTLVVDPVATDTVTLALVGVHAVGTVPNHPEFIWSSFEHVDNAPACAATPVAARNPATGQPWSFYPGNASCSGPFSSCNIGRTVAQFQSFTPNTVCQVNPWGDTVQASPNRANILALNASVQSLLPAGSLLRNYVLLGGIWTRADTVAEGILPFTTAQEHGSPLLANTAMESFTQATNCLGCHTVNRNSADPWEQKNIAISHAFPVSLVRSLMAAD